MTLAIASTATLGVGNLTSLAKSTQDLAITIILLATLIALLMETIYIFGFRSFLQRYWFCSWLEQKRTVNNRKLRELRELKEIELVELKKIKELEERRKDFSQESSSFSKTGNSQTASKKLDDIESCLSLQTKISKSLMKFLTSRNRKKRSLKYEATEERGVTEISLDRFYSLSVQRLCGQVSSIVQTELDYLSADSNLFYCFIVNLSLGDLEKVARLMSHVNSHQNLSNLLKTQKEESSDKELSSVEEEMAEIKQRLYYHTEREIDDLQVYLVQKWNHQDYIFAILISSILVGLLLNQSKISIFPIAGFNLLIILVALAAALLAPVVRDLIARWILQR